jgi:hypothetical protein
MNLNRFISPKAALQIATKYVKRYSTSLISREMQMKTTIRYHLIPVGIVTIKNNNKYWWRLWKNWNPCTLLVGI